MQFGRTTDGALADKDFTTCHAMWPTRPMVERLECRQLLSATAAVAAGRGTAPPRATSPSAAVVAAAKPALVGRAGPALAGLSAEYAGFRAAGGRGTFRPTDPGLRVSGTRVSVEVFAEPGQGAAVADRLRAAGMTDVARHGTAVGGKLPLAAIDRLATTPGVRFARPALWTTRAGATTSQGDVAQRAGAARAAAATAGSGVKVGVLSDSFDTSSSSIRYANDVASGDLPANVQVLADFPGGTDEGRAMAQLIYDSAPGAALAFATVGDSEAAFANNIRALRNAGASVIVDDVIFFAEPMFQDGVVARAVDEVVASGASYFSAVGNDGRQGYESAFRTGLVRPQGSVPAASGLAFHGGTTHDFDPGALVDDTQSFTLQPGQDITLSFQWDQPYYSASGGAGSQSDLDIYVLNAAGTQVLDSSDYENIGDDPIEILQFVNRGTTAATYNLMIVRYAGASPTAMKYVNFGSGTFNQYNTNSGTVFGHANAAGAAAVGAAAWFETPAYGTTPPRVEPFSSAGPTPIVIGPTGARLAAPQVRAAPRFVAPDGGNTTFFGEPLNDGDAFPNFFGTSAAAPTAAAAAALLLAADPSLTPAGVYDVLANTAIDMDDPATSGFDTGFDFGTGRGLIQADRAVAALRPVVQSAVVNDGAVQRSRVTSLTVTFSRAVAAAAGGFRLARRDGGAAAGVTAAPSADGRVVVLTFAGTGTDFGSLADGLYDLTVAGAGVRITGGGTLTMAADYALAFHRLFADADGDRDVDGADSRGFRGALGSEVGMSAYNSIFDFDVDGDVDGADSRAFRRRLGTEI